MKPSTVLIVLLALLVIFPYPARAGVLASSTFEVVNDKDGWTAHELNGGPNTVTYMNPGGNPGGFLNAIDHQDGHSWYWIAPAKFLGDVSAAYGGTTRPATGLPTPSRSWRPPGTSITSPGQPPTLTSFMRPSPRSPT